MLTAQTERMSTAVPDQGSFDHVCRGRWWQPAWVLCRCTCWDRNEYQRCRRTRWAPPGSRSASGEWVSSESERQNRRIAQRARSFLPRCCPTRPARTRCLRWSWHTLQQDSTIGRRQSRHGSDGSDRSTGSTGHSSSKLQQIDRN